METNTLAILIPMILGFLGVVLSTNSMVNNAVKSMAGSINRRIDDFRADVDRRFDEVDHRIDKVDHRIDKEFGHLDKNIGEMRTRLDTYIDAFAIRLSTSHPRTAKKRA